MGIISALERRLAVQPAPIDRILVVERSTGRLIDARGEELEVDRRLARGVAIAAAVLSAVGRELGSTLLRLEVSYSSKEVTVEVGEDVLKLSVRTC